MKTYRGSGGIAPAFLTSTLDGGEWSASRPGRFTLRERAPGTHWIGGWVGPRAAVVEMGQGRLWIKATSIYENGKVQGRSKITFYGKKVYRLQKYIY